MKSSPIFLFGLLLLTLITHTALAGPILKPRKYYGPIPRKSVALRVGFFSGASNQEMYDYLELKVSERGGQSKTDDFGNSLVIDGTYTVKLHPQFAIRTNAAFKILRSNSNGFFVASTGDTIEPVRDFKREFNVEIFAISGEGVYYFTDASVKDFQPYIGGGFALWVPRATYKETLTDRDTGSLVRESQKTDWSLEAAIQGVLGAHYYLNNTFAITAESRFHIAQSSFPLTITTSEGAVRDVNMIVDYSGFLITVGVLKAF